MNQAWDGHLSELLQPSGGGASICVRSVSGFAFIDQRIQVTSAIPPRYSFFFAGGSRPQYSACLLLDDKFECLAGMIFGAVELGYGGIGVGFVVPKFRLPCLPWRYPRLATKIVPSRRVALSGPAVCYRIHGNRLNYERPAYLSDNGYFTLLLQKKKNE